MTRKLNPGDSVTLERTLTPGFGRAINRPMRVLVRRDVVTYCGPINCDPVLVHVRGADGSLLRVDPADLR